jgi:hypothetical protein
MIMKITVRAAIMMFSIGTISTHAGDTDGYSPATLFISVPGGQFSSVAAAPRQVEITIPNGAVVHRYLITSRPLQLAAPASPGQRRTLTTFSSGAKRSSYTS